MTTMQQCSIIKVALPGGITRAVGTFSEVALCQISLEMSTCICGFLDTWYNLVLNKKRWHLHCGFIPLFAFTNSSNIRWMCLTLCTLLEVGALVVLLDLVPTAGTCYLLQNVSFCRIFIATCKLTGRHLQHTSHSMRPIAS